eukprot:2949786-Pyramimonas_sp.AAC.1
MRSVELIRPAQDSNERSTHFWLVRHGESTNNVIMDRIFSDPKLPAWKARLKFTLERDPDPSLSELGQEQVAALQRHPGLQKLLSSRRPVVMYSSPLRRAIETAAALQEVLVGDNEIILKASS